MLVCPQTTAMTRARCIQWVQVAQCEAGGQQSNVTSKSVSQIGWHINRAFDGGLQFSVRTWQGNIYRIPSRKLTYLQRRARAAGRYSYAYNAPSSVQILAAEVLRLRPDSSGLGNWPACGSRFYA